MQTQYGFSEENPHFLMDEQDLCKAKLEGVIIPERTTDDRKENSKRDVTSGISQTMEDVAKKYREINLNDESGIEGQPDDNNNVDEEEDDDLLKSDSEADFGEVEGRDESQYNQEEQQCQPGGLSTDRESKWPSGNQVGCAVDEIVCADGREVDREVQAKNEFGRISRSISQVGTASKKARPSDRISFSSTASAPGWTADNEYLRRLEADQEELNGSLLALTSHFAQVQFRLKQVKAAPPAEKERLLSELEALAFRGVPDLRILHEEDAGQDENEDDGGATSETEPGGRYKPRTAVRGRKQTALIERLKAQLADLEQLAYESGELPALPTAKQLHNQRVLMERLQQRLALRNDGSSATSSADAAGAISELLGNLERVPAEQRDFDDIVERAVGAILNPVRVKEKVVEQLKTQIVDLERFITFLQNGSQGPLPSDANTHSHAAAILTNGSSAAKRKPNTADSRTLSSRVEGIASTSATSASDLAHTRRGADRGEKPSESRSDRARTGLHDHSQVLHAERVGADVHRHSSRNSARTLNEHADADVANGMMKRMAALLHIFVLTNLTCMNRGRVAHSPNANTAAVHVNTVKEHHYGQSLARLQVLVDRVCQLASANDCDAPGPASTPLSSSSTGTRTRGATSTRLRSPQTEGDDHTTLANNSRLHLSSVANTDTAEAHVQPDASVAYASDDDECYLATHEHTLTSLVRKQLLLVVRELLEHGMLDARDSRPALAACFSTSSTARPPTTTQRARRAHAWRLFARYYELKGGRQWNAQPARNLSAAFAIDVVGGRSVSAKQTLLAAIDRVLALHSKFKRSDDAKFKSLLCLALNERHIVAWLRLIVHNQSIVDEFYESWSYVAMSGFEDALRALARLQSVTFHLPFDLAVRQLQNIKDVF